ncbi:hypothetical protein RJ640_015049 [Escallonia rubra]|uniref:C3H1-type domain-containing protein n=1 Tax=Escallonia rubra TaxID=112253 RepID=A0AA88UQ87_9ASTE|nr:hypothetical protein RJ640_015049 [Escallonia rubra]
MSLSTPPATYTSPTSSTTSSGKSTLKAKPYPLQIPTFHAQSGRARHAVQLLWAQQECGYFDVEIGYYNLLVKQMYGQGNFAHQFGSDPHNFMQPIQQRPPRPLTVPPGLPRPAQLGPHVYPHAPPFQGPTLPVPPSGMLSSGQSYLTPPPPPPPPPPQQVQGSTQLAHSYSTGQQNSPWSHNVHHIPPRLAAPRVLNPPRTPPQGQALYRGPVPPQPANSQGLPLPPPPPPPPNSTFFTPNPFGNLVQSAQRDSHMPLMVLPAPPPPPSSPPKSPPLPPFSPPPTSSAPCSGTPSLASLPAATVLPHHSQSGPGSTKASSFNVMAFVDNNRESAPDQLDNDAQRHDDPSNRSLPSGGNLNLDLTPPPLKPTDEKIARKIEVLCQYISKNGPGFEDMTRQNELGNPEFQFLFGGERGSEAAAGHEYFLWMKKKYSLASRLHERQQHSDSSWGPSGVDSSLQLNSAMDAELPPSPADSDMDMEVHLFSVFFVLEDFSTSFSLSMKSVRNVFEDANCAEPGTGFTGSQNDITQPEEEHKVYKLLATPNQESVIKSDCLDTEKQLHSPQNASERSPGKCAIVGAVEQGEGPHVSLENDHYPVGAAISPLHPNIDGSSIYPHKNMGQAIASEALAGMSSEKAPSQLIKGASPFRLLQDYASDDSSENDDKPCLEDVIPARATALPLVKTDVDGHAGSDFRTDLGSKDPSDSEHGLGPIPKSAVKCTLGLPSESLHSSIGLQSSVRKTDSISIPIGLGELVEDNHGNQSHDSDTSHKAFEVENASEGGIVPAPSERGRSQKEDLKYKSNRSKVDEFGRLVRENASDSDSDDNRYTRRHGKRGRSWSRSRSPVVRRRRSPWRRKEKRSRSRSWSPKRRRSRSKSPPVRRGGEFGGDRTRRDNVQLQPCLDYQRGKCYRGALCRYLHHDSGKSDGARRQRSKVEYRDVPPSSKNSEVPDYEHDKAKSEATRLHDQKDLVVSPRNAGQSVTLHQDREPKVLSVAESERARELIAQLQHTQDMREGLVEATFHLPENGSSFPATLVTDADVENLPSDTSAAGPSSFNNLVSQQSQATLTGLVDQNADRQNQISSVHPYPGMGSSSMQDSSESLGVKELFPHVSHPVASVSHSTNPPLPPLLPEDYKTMPPTTNYPSFSSAGYPPYQHSLPYQHTHFSVPPNPSWNPLPPPPPRPPYANVIVNATSTQHGVPSSEHQQNQLPPRNEFPLQTLVSPCSSEMQTRSQFGEFHNRSYPLMQASGGPLSNMEDFKSRTLSVSNPVTQQFGRPGPAQGLISSNSFDQGSLHPHPLPFSRDSPARRTESFSGEALLPAQFPYFQQPSHGFQRPAADSVSRYPSDFLDRNQSVDLADFGGSRISKHYNPYASTFDQPLSSKYSLNAVNQEKDTAHGIKYDAPSNSSHAAVDGQAIGNIGSRNSTFSPKSAQYDPLFDSIEPSSNSLRKSDRRQKHEITDESDALLRISGSNVALDVEENNKKKEAGAVVVTISPDNDEFGETADAEVGVVENGSPSDPIDMADLAAGDIEIDQVRSPGRSKKSKDSRSTKLFKVALADFVKEVLKPSWRQGNMSKEAFKTIVKKTVDKVSGAMKSHQVPKSQAKIDHYIDSSQRKLTKLVMVNLLFSFHFVSYGILILHCRGVLCVTEI